MASSFACEEFSHASVVTVHHEKQQNLVHSAVRERRRGTPRSSAPRTARTSGGAAPAPRVAPRRPVAAPAGAVRAGESGFIVPRHAPQRLQGRCALAGQAPPARCTAAAAALCSQISSREVLFTVAPPGGGDTAAGQTAPTIHRSICNTLLADLNEFEYCRPSTALGDGANWRSMPFKIHCSRN